MAEHVSKWPSRHRLDDTKLLAKGTMKPDTSSDAWIEMRKSRLLWGIESGVFATLPGGFMVYAAIVYSFVMSASMVLFGRALIDRIEQRNRDEAQLRYEMGRVRDEVKGLRATMQLVTAA